MPSLLSALFPPSPPFTESNLPSSLAGKVYIITGAASGVGFELAKMLYSKGGSVYIAARSSSRCAEAIQKIKIETQSQKSGGKDSKKGGVGNNGKLEPMVIDLADLGTVKGAVEGFLAKEGRLDVLFHNAGVMTPPTGSKSKNGIDLEMSTNCLAPYLLTILLEPILRRTAATATATGEVRIIWVISLMQLGTPAGGMDFDGRGTPVIRSKPMDNYMQSKVGGAWMASEFAKRLGGDGIVSVSLHPGLMKTELQRNMPSPGRLIMGLVFKPPIYGAYSELYSGFSPELTKKEHNGGYLMAWGRKAELPVDVTNGLKDTAAGGSGAARRFFDYCDRETKAFL